jgi:hypothetical protein
MKAPILLIALVMLAGCTTSNFTLYEGAQNWPVSQGALVDRKFAVPVYYGPPSQPYIVMGSLDIGNATAAIKWSVAFFVVPRGRISRCHGSSFCPGMRRESELDCFSISARSMIQISTQDNNGKWRENRYSCSRRTVTEFLRTNQQRIPRKPPMLARRTRHPVERMTHGTHLPQPFQC